MTQYRPVPPQVDLPALEREVLALWAEQQTFEKSVELTRDGTPWTFYEGPPTANGMPGTHHVEARVFKDLFPRFQTMLQSRGYPVSLMVMPGHHHFSLTYALSNPGDPLMAAMLKQMGL